MSKFIFAAITRTRSWPTRTTPLSSSRVSNSLAQPCRRYAQVRQTTPGGTRDRSAIGVRHSSSATSSEMTFDVVFAGVHAGRCSAVRRYRCRSVLLLPVREAEVTGEKRSVVICTPGIAPMYLTWTPLQSKSANLVPSDDPTLAVHSRSRRTKANPSRKKISWANGVSSTLDSPIAPTFALLNWTRSACSSSPWVRRP